MILALTVMAAGSACQPLGPWGWGSNQAGQLGDGTATNRSQPTAIEGRWASVAIGQRHTLAIRADGSLWAWGGNGSGQLGDGTATGHDRPTRIGADSNWVSVATGLYTSFGIRADGTLWAWGANNTGQLGDGTTTSPRLLPGQVGSATNWVDVSAGCATPHDSAFRS